MADAVNSLADNVGMGIQSSPTCLLAATCPSSTPSGPIIPSTSIDISTTLPSSDVRSTTSHPSPPISPPSTTTTPSAIPTSFSPLRSTPHFFPPTTIQSTQPTSPPVNIASSVSSSEPKSITTTLLSTSGAQVVTITSVIENPAAILNQPNDNSSGPNSFMSNRAAVIGVFTAVGVTVLVLLLTLVLYIFRKRQARRQLEKDHAAAAVRARGFLDDEDELGNEKGWWHGDSGTSLPGVQPVDYNSGPLDYSRPYVGTAHPYASAPTLNRIAPPVVDTYSGRQASIQTPPGYGSPSTTTTDAQLLPSTEHVPQPPRQSTPALHVQVQESSGGSAHPYASLRRHTAYELLAEDVLAQQSTHHVRQPSTEIPGTETAARGHSPGHLGISTPEVHTSPFSTASDLFTDGSRGGGAEQEQWYDDTDSESHGENGNGGLVSLPPPGLQDVVERARHPAHDPRFSGVFGPSAAWTPTYLHHPRDSVDAGTIREEDQERFGGNGRILTIANA